MSEAWIAALRHEYESESFGMSDADPDPFVQFERWFGEAMNSQVDEPNAMVLSTADAAGTPDSRAVLLKSFDDAGFVFFSNYGSKKAADIAASPAVALLFVWLPLHRQVRVQGTAAKIPADRSDDYFSTRPLGARIGAIASPQSREIPGRAWLQSRYDEVSAGADDGLARPDDWGGYLVTPSAFEFWQGRENRLHDRIRYSPAGSGWHRVRLAP